MTFTGEPLLRADAPWLLALPLSAVVVAVVLALRPGTRLARVVPALPVIAAAFVLALVPHGGVLHHHFASLVRLGFVDLRFDLVADQGTGAIALAAGLTLWIVTPSARRSALLALGLFVVTIDDRILAAVGWVVLVALAVQRHTPRVLSAMAIALGVVLFWALGGAYTGEGYAPEMGARVVAIVAGEPAPVSIDADDDDDDVAMPAYAPGDRGTFSVRALPGATLYVDGSRTPLGGAHPLTSPFEGQPIPVGFHAFRLHLGRAYDDYVVTQVRIDPGQRLTLVSTGSTTSATDARDLSAKGLHERRLFGVPLTLVLGALAVLASVALFRDPLLAAVAIGLVYPIATLLGPSPDVAMVALVVAMPAALVSGRPDVFLALAALFVGVPVPAVLALALASFVPNRRAAAAVSLVPRAMLIFALRGSAAGHVGIAIALAASLATMVGRRDGDVRVPKWYILILAIGALGASGLFLLRPPSWALLLAVAVSVAALPAARGWESDHRRRRRDYARFVRRAWSLLRFVGEGLAALERRALDVREDER